MRNSIRYSGKKGEDYFRYQDAIGLAGAAIEVRKFAPYVDKDDAIMDFGCGGGHLLAALDCKRKCGVEVNPVARQRAMRYGFPVFEHCSSIEKGSLDKVISNHCLEHVLSPVEALIQIKETLRIGGKLILCIPIDDWRTQKQFSEGDINHHLYTWTPQLIGNCLSEAGYHVDKVRVYTHAWPPYFALWNRLLPTRLFDIVCWLTSICLKRRQIMAIATKPAV